MSLVKHFNLAKMSRDQLHNLLGAAFIAAARAETGSRDQQDAQDLVDAIQFELVVRLYLSPIAGN
ncbi:MAG: hypothetical protein AAF709_09720 [Pseudomonadota bacterium]